MSQKTIMLTKPTITLPKSWKDTKVMVQFPNKATVVIKKMLKQPKVEVDYSTDEKNWERIAPDLRSVREEVVREFYPQLYGKPKKKGS